MNLNGKTLFVTGASRGIGLAIAKRAARDGANIVIAAKTAEANPKLPGTIHSAAAEIEAAGGRALALQTDIRDEANVLAAVEQAVARFGGIDILVNNAAVRAEEVFETMTLARWRAVTAVILEGAFNCTQACLPWLKRSGAGGGSGAAPRRLGAGGLPAKVASSSAISARSLGSPASATAVATCSR